MQIPVVFPIGALLLLASACTGGGSNPRADEAIPRDRFVQAYHQLRVEGLKTPDMEIRIEDRDRILNEQGVTQEDLLTFAEVWGADGEFMQGIWEEVDSLFREGGRDRAEDPSIDGYEEDPNPRAGRGLSRGGEETPDPPPGRGRGGDEGGGP